MKTLKYGNESIVIDDENSFGKTGIAIHNVDELEDTIVIDTEEIKNALEDTFVEIDLNLEENENE